MPTSQGLSRPLQVILHIGTGKTGTSSIQHCLRANFEWLRSVGILYPRTPGPVGHSRLGLFIKPDAELEIARLPFTQKRPDPRRFRKSFRRALMSEIQTFDLPRVLFSDEALYASSDLALRRLRRFCDRIGDNLRLVVYLRRQDDRLVSVYQQRVKAGEVRPLIAWAQRDLSAKFDYYAGLCRHKQLLGPATFVVRRFEPDSFVDGSLYQDFFTAADIQARAEDWQPVANHNQSLDAACVEFLRLLNLYRAENEPTGTRMFDNRKLVRRLSVASTGPTLTLPAAFLDEFMAQRDESNRRVAREFFGDASGHLFRMPRKTRNTTTEQRLDPRRVSDFLALLELPERMHDALRELAEREARSGRAALPGGP